MKYRDRAFVQKLDAADTSFSEALNDDDFESAYKSVNCTSTIFAILPFTFIIAL